jgi:putative FmdB family regulatory protein
MPLYEYECSKCGKHFERIEKFSGPNLKKCPNCGGRVERLLSAPAIQFKGGGWYVTDYGRSSGAASSKQAEAGGASGGETKSDGKSESKSDSKTDAKIASATKDKKKPTAKEK